MRKSLRWLLALAVTAVLIQWVPYGRDHSNPPVVAEPSWDRPETRALFFQACKDCHSNETSWPWYGSVAPMSWLVMRDVSAGRSHFNVSEWGRERNHGEDAAKLVREGEMPPWFYLPAHPEARLSESDRERLEAGLAATFGQGDGEHSHHGDHEH